MKAFLGSKPKMGDQKAEQTISVLRDCGYDNGEFSHIRFCIAMVDVRTISSDIEEKTGYQREVTMERVNKIVDNFHPIKLDPITIAIMPNGERKCLDGQARTVALTALYKRGIVDSPMVECKVLYGATQRDLAELFTRQDEGKTVLKEKDKSKAEIGWKESTIILNDLLFSHGISLMRDVKAHYAIKTIFEEMPIDTFDRMINVISSAWDIKRTKNVLCSQLLNGFACFYGVYSNEIEDDFLINKLKKTTPERILADFRNYDVSNDKNRKYLKTFSMVYNKSKKTNRIDYI